MSKIEQVIAEVLIDNSMTTDAKIESLSEYFGELLEALSEDTECSFDHHGGCQAHYFLSLEHGEKCPNYVARELLGQQL